MKRKLAVLGLLVLAGLAVAACQNEDPGGGSGDQNTNTNNNYFFFGPTPPSPSPSPSASPVALHLGCDIMRGPGGQVLPACAPGLADYEAPAGSTGRLDGTLVDANGLKIVGHNYAAEWEVLNGDCSLSGEQSGPDAWNPGILIAAGDCDVQVRSLSFAAKRTFRGV